MKTGDWALVVSLVSLLIAMASFVWNVWSKFIYPKPKVVISFGVKRIYEVGAKEPSEPFLDLAATNFGPGSVTLHIAVAKLRRSWFRKRVFGMLNPMHDFPERTDQTIGPFSGGLPKKIDVGESFSAYFPLEIAHRPDEPLVGISFSDTFHRNHWAPRRQVRKVREEVRKLLLKD